MVEMVEDAGERTERIVSLDVLKGAAIIGVIIAHLSLDDYVTDNSWTYTIGEFFYAALPMFIIISGYVYRPGRGFSYNARKRLLPLAIAIFAGTVVLTLITYCYLLVLGYDLSGCDLWGDIFNAVIGRGSFTEIPGTKIILGPYDVTFQFYYLMALLFGHVIFYLIADRIRGDWRKTAVSVVVLASITCFYILLGGIQLPFYLQLSPIVAALLLVGSFLGEHRFMEYLERGWKKKNYWTILAVVGVVSIICIVFFPTGTKFCYTEFGRYGAWSVYTFILLSVSTGTVLLYLASLVALIPYVSGFLTFIGKKCLPLYILHVFIAKLLIAPFAQVTSYDYLPIESTAEGLILAAASIIIILALTYVLGRLTKKEEPESLM